MSDINILIGAEKFADLRKRNFYYVDKTAFLENFLSSSQASVALFTRPRRFGKTLFMSMLAEFFDVTKDSRSLFEGLAVSRNTNLCKEWMNQYPVISLSLKGVGGASFEDAFAKFRNQIMKCVARYHAIYEDPAVNPLDRMWLNEIQQQKADKSVLAEALCTMSRALAAYYKRPAIILVDEYDVPVAKAAENGYYDEMIDFERDFLCSALKTNDDLIFGVLTGCLRITRESIFTGLNNIKCYDIADSDYADVFGFTQGEVDTLLADAGLSSKREEVRAWYDGYRFGENQEIYCPWSILNYVVDHKNNPQLEPKAYWLHSSDNALVQRLVAHNSTDLSPTIDTLLDGSTLQTQINLTPNYKNLASTAANIWSLLYLTGYLTRTPKDAAYALPGTDRLAIPNREVEEIFREDLKEWFSHRLAGSQRTELYQAFWQADAEHFARLLSDILLVSISMYDYREHFYHGVLTGIFLSTKTCTISNLEAGEGRSDILVWEGDNAAVIEVKRTEKEEELPALLDQGMRQIVDNQYDARFRANPEIRTIYHWSVAFCRKSCLARAVLACKR